MNQVGNNQQYLIIAKDKNSIQYEIIMSINILKDTLNLIIEPNENFYQKYKAELNLESVRNIHNSLQVDSIQDAYNEIVNLVEYNKKNGIENKISLEQNMILIIPYAHNSIKFELQRKDLNFGDKFNNLEKMIKNLQNQINTMNERIKKLENNVKEYNSNGKLIFDGEYKDGKRYIGKEYNDWGKLIFDGEYKDGKRYIGKEYNDWGKLIFDGEYKRGKRYIGKDNNNEGKLIIYQCAYNFIISPDLNGQIKKYNENNILLYEGEIKEGKIWNGTFYDLRGIICGKVINGSGKVKEYGPFNKLLFEGEYKDGKKYNGKAYLYSDNLRHKLTTFEYKDGEIFSTRLFLPGGNLEWEIQGNEGNHFLKHYDEKGRLLFEGTTSIAAIICGDKKENIYKDGKITIYDINDELEFEGEIIKGERKKGTQYIKANSQIFINNTTNPHQVNPEDKIKFEGEIKGALWWTGKFYLINNSGNKTFLGELNEGNGRIKKFWDFEEFEGEVRNGNFWKGSYKKYNIKGKIIFDGEWRDGHKYKGKEYNDNGVLIFDGEYDNKKKYKGKEYVSGKLVFEGEYKNGEKYKGKEYDNYYENKQIFDGEYKDGKKWNGEITIDNYNQKFKGEIREGIWWNGQGESKDFIGEFRDGKKWTGYGKGKNGEYNVIFKEGKTYSYK